MNNFFKEIKLFILDLDGILCIGNNIIPNAIELVSYLRKHYRVVFFSNTSGKTSIQVCEKLNRLGIDCTEEKVFTASSSTVFYLKEKNINNVFVIGSNDFKDEIKKQKINIIQNSTADNLIVGLDTKFNYRKIDIALSILLKGGKFIVCNEDRYYPIENNKYLPGCGAMVGSISSIINKKPDFIVGKPNTYVLEKISEMYKVTNKEMVVVGDSYESDIQMALNYNCKSIFINKDGYKSKDIVSLKNLSEMLFFLKNNKE
jgi:HAD superfamily hydrolase (TIGR01450 family)